MFGLWRKEKEMSDSKEAGEELRERFSEGSIKSLVLMGGPEEKERLR